MFAFAAERRRRAQAPQQLSIDICCPQDAQQQTGRLLLLLLIYETDRRTERRTDGRPTIT